MAALIVLALGLAHEAAAATPAPRPHIIFVMIDDLGWSNVGWHDLDQSLITTGPGQPHMKKLVAEESITLDRHYAYPYCSPTRASTLTGRLPYHVNQINIGSFLPGAGVARNMTMIPAKLKKAGYSTHMIGKWHLGYATYDMLPFGRGFDTSFHYQEGAMDHWSSCNCVDGMCSAPNNGYSNGPNSSSATEHCWATIATPDAAPVDDCRAEPGCKDGAHGAGPGTLLEMKGTGMADLWCTDQPCYGRNNTGEYNDLLFTQEAIRLIEENDPRVPFFMYFALQVNHSPLEVPFEYMDKYPAEQYWNQRIMNGMSNFWDESIHNITLALKRTGMWNKTLLIMSGDNGGPVYWTETPAYPHGGSANNYPLKGGKSSTLEGGVRVSAFASGGMIPPAMRGKVFSDPSQMIHVCDWFHTFASLAGVDYLDAPANLPSNEDSLDMWPLLSGQVEVSPRNETVIALQGHTGGASATGQFEPNNVTALIQGDYKLLLGGVGSNFWQGPAFPNASYTAWMEKAGKAWGIVTSASCGVVTNPAAGCLFNIKEDPTEHHDLAKEMPQKVAEMKARVLELTPTLFNPDRCHPYKVLKTPAGVEYCGGYADHAKAAQFFGGFPGPYLPPYMQPI